MNYVNLLLPFLCLYGVSCLIGPLSLGERYMKLFHLSRKFISVPLNPRRWYELVWTEPRNYSTFVLLISNDTSCLVCRDVYKEYKVLAKSYVALDWPQPEIFFAHAFYEIAPKIFLDLKTTNVPDIFYFDSHVYIPSKAARFGMQLKESSLAESFAKFVFEKTGHMIQIHRETSLTVVIISIAVCICLVLLYMSEAIIDFWNSLDLKEIAYFFFSTTLINLLICWICGMYHNLVLRPPLGVNFSGSKMGNKKPFIYPAKRWDKQTIFESIMMVFAYQTCFYTLMGIIEFGHVQISYRRHGRRHGRQLSASFAVLLFLFVFMCSFGFLYYNMAIKRPNPEHSKSILPTYQKIVYVPNIL